VFKLWKKSQKFLPENLTKKSQKSGASKELTEFAELRWAGEVILSRILTVKFVVRLCKPKIKSGKEKESHYQIRKETPDNDNGHGPLRIGPDGMG